MKTYEVRLSGSGGQGVILASIILAEAAIIEGKNSVQTQSYGPEARGGASKAEVIISENEIDFPKVRNCDVFLSLTQKSFDEYCTGVKSDGITIVDSSVNVGNKEVYSIPIIDSAHNELKKPIVTNIVALGTLVAITKIVSREAIETAVLNRVPKGTEELNREALNIGFKLGNEAI